MVEQPSWRTSTLSQAFVVALGFYMVFVLLLTVGVIFVKLPIETAEKVLPWGTALWGSVTSAYLAARKVNGEIKPPEEPPKP